MQKIDFTKRTTLTFSGVILLLSFIFCLGPQGSQAAGLSLHLAMGELARKNLPEGELKQLLSRHKSSYRNGSLFPDVGYRGQAPYAEWTHWAPFFNAYAEKFNRNCSYPWEQKCEEQLAFYLGCLAHMVGDVNFDRYFVTEVARQDFAGDLSAAQGYTDKSMDFIAATEIPETQVGVGFSWPKDFLVEIYQEAGFAVTAKELSRQTTVNWAFLVGIQTFGPHLYARLSNGPAWARHHYQSARGGFHDTSRRIGELWQSVWAALTKDPETPALPRIITEGHWPYNDYRLEGQ